MHPRRLAVAAALALSLAACGRGAEEPTAEPSAPTAQEPTTSASPETPASPSPSASPDADETAGTTEPEDEPTSEPEGFTTAPVQDPSFPAGGGDLLHGTVRVGVHDGYDRVVFDLIGSDVPGYRVEYVDQAIEDGSGNPVAVDGDAILQVVITKTRYPEEGEQYEGGPGTYDAAGAEKVEEVVLSGTFEGMTQAFVGVDDGPAPFRVFTLTDPTRLVVDIQHTDG